MPPKNISNELGYLGRLSKAELGMPKFSWYKWTTVLLPIVLLFFLIQEYSVDPPHQTPVLESAPVHTGQAKKNVAEVQPDLEIEGSKGDLNQRLSPNVRLDAIDELLEENEPRPGILYTEDFDELEQMEEAEREAAGREDYFLQKSRRVGPRGPRKRYALIRAIGNDLPPRHAVGQSYENLKFILLHEEIMPELDKYVEVFFFLG